MIYIQMPKGAKNKTIEGIASEVSEYYQVSVADMQSPSRKREITVARQVSIYLAKTHTRHTFKTIAEYFGCRDHTTAIHAKQNISNLMFSDPEFRDEVQRLEALI